MMRGAKIGAVSCGLLGFSSGIGVCLHYHLPVPPLFVTEMGIIGGGALGALIALARTDHRGRQLLAGIIMGLLGGLAMALVAPPNLRGAVFGATLSLGLFLGYQAGMVEPQMKSPWAIAPRRA